MATTERELADPIYQLNWDQVKRFTPELYQRYEKAPIWEIDNPEFRGPGDYESYWKEEIGSMYSTSKGALGNWQAAGANASQAVETQSQTGLEVYDFKSALAADPLPIAISMIQEKVALLSANPPLGEYMRQQESQTQQVAGLNGMADMVMQSVDWECLVSEAHYDIQFWNCAIFRWDVNLDEPGILGNRGALSLSLCPSGDIFFDPNCKRLDAKAMDYVIQRHKMQKGDIQMQYPLTGRRVDDMTSERIGSASSLDAINSATDVIQSPQPKLASGKKQQSLEVFEAWIRDSRLKFQPSILNAESSDYTKRYQTDEDGYLIGDWVKRYPDGRLIVMCGDVVLRDVANPLPHGQFPYVFVKAMPSKKPFCFGAATRLIQVTRKINDMLGNLHRYYQSEVPRPMHQSPGAILDPNLAQNIPNDPSYALELSSMNAVLVRPQSQDVPMGVFQYISILQTIIDMVSGSSGIMRGQLEESSQISAEAMAALQQFASSRLALETRFFNVSVKQLYYQLEWLLRALVDANYKLTITLPNGKQEIVDWKSDRAVFISGDPIQIQSLRKNQDYTIGIRAGTGAPGAQQQQQASALALYTNNAIDRKALLDITQQPDRESIVKRMDDRELEMIKAKAIGKEIGVNMSEAIKSDRPGRKEKI